ncbi:hypothetical protein F4Y93_05970 [Candidatus Poribacteria bacterium]|nr:hypothetical protein [Candidatus Poribacteria bacterium]
METQEKLKHLIDDAFAQLQQAHQREIDALLARLEALQAKVKIQTEAETDVRIREIAAHQGISVEVWIEDAIQQKIAYGDNPMIRVETYFYEQLKAYATAKGFMPEALTTSPEATQHFMALINNFVV